MSILVTSSYRSAEVPEDIEGAARRLADRKVRRLLDDVSTPPFIAIVELLDRAGLTDASDVALFTVSGWDNSQVLQAIQAGTSGIEARYGHGTDPGEDPGNPTDWLRHLCNATLCQSAIAGRLRGPNAHLVGGADAFCHALALASAVLEQDAATHALVVAFDVAGTDAPPRSRAAGLVLALEAAGEDAGWVLALPEPAAGDESALAIADRCIATATSPDGATEAIVDVTDHLTSPAGVGATAVVERG